jgi:hypothetical protein
MRLPTSRCLLCTVNYAEKSNSHIIPKFLVKDIFLSKTTSAQVPGGYLMRDKNGNIYKSKSQQDSPKEDYILCDGCEKYLGYLEDYVARHFFRNRYEHSNEHLFQIKKLNDVQIAQYKLVNPILIQLFILSIFWRGSISSMFHVP